MKEFKRGKVLRTTQNAKYSQDEIDGMQRLEESVIFTDFIERDFGRGRKAVCKLERSHPDYEQNARLISAAPELLEACLEVIKIWNEDGEGGEIQLKTPIAWYRALRKSEKAINKALGE